MSRRSSTATPPVPNGSLTTTPARVPNESPLSQGFWAVTPPPALQRISSGSSVTPPIAPSVSPVTSHFILDPDGFDRFNELKASQIHPQPQRR